MNIFITDASPIISAQNLCDKRLKHMPKEYIECLTAYIHSVTNNWVVPFPLWGDIDRNEPLFLYNHPVTKWVRKDKANTWWLYVHLLETFKEYEYRFDDVNPVKRYLPSIIPFMIETDNKPKSFQNSSLYKQLPVIEAYRATMINKWTVTDKVQPVKFTKRGKPDWFK
jgi:hypothetical protein